MKISFEYTEKEYKKYLIRNRKINNIIIFILGVVIYLALTFKQVSLLFFPLFIIGLLIIIYLLNLIYVTLYIKVNNMMNYNTYGKYIVELTPNKFSVTLNKNKVDYKYNSIKRIKEYKNSFKIKFKNSREYLTFEKNKINEYDKMLKYLKEKVK